MQFVHLHNHSDYSILDGAITVDRLIDRAIELGMPAVALTDHGNMFGAIDFYLKAKKKGIVPIVGQEFYMAPGSRFKKESVKGTGEENAHHLILLAKNETGYKNLIKLSSIGFTEGFYYKPRIDLEVLEKHSEGLICSTACIAGQVPRAIIKGNYNEAKEIAGRFSEIFGKDNFYLELQYHGIKEQEIANRELIKLSSELNLPLIATNDAHYLKKEDAYSHEVLLCIQTGKTMKDESRMKFGGSEFYFKTPEEMAALFADYPDALYNTYSISQMIDLELSLGNPILPNFIVPEGFNLDSYLEHLVTEGALKRFGGVISGEVRKRIDYELSVIKKMHFSGYFLIVWDFIKYAKSVGIPVGPGRGSAAGSIVSYSLGITALNPLKYNLLFERFLNPERNEMPDMDIDFCAERREEIIRYIKDKYGDDKVSQIITFNKMKSKLVIKDVARTLDIPFERANEISNMIEEKTLDEVLKKSKEFKDSYNKGIIPRELVDISLKLEGLVRSAGKHAAGIVISKGPLTDYVPLYKDPKDGGISSQYEKDTLEKTGLVKMDLLGLKNLTIIDKCLKKIKISTGEDLNLEEIPLDDKKTFKLLQSAETKGIFQLESSGMQNLLRRLGPSEFEEIIAIVALYRPGPLNSGMADDYIKHKRDMSSIKYPHKVLETVLKDTLGVIVYQEQVMLISQLVAGFTMPEADKLRKAMGKKLIHIINDLENKFIEGALKKGFEKDFAENIYSNIKKFGEYGFNKSHSAAYALVTYQTAYLKAHFPIQFMTALLSAQPDNQSDVIQYVNDCRAKGIKILSPSINTSGYDFTIEEKSIRFGLGAIKGLGGKVIESIINARESGGEFKNLRDFLERVGLASLNKGVFEALIKSGSMDCLHPVRAELFLSIDYLIDTAKRIQEDKLSGQGNLFEIFQAAKEGSSEIILPVSAKWADNEKLTHEKEVLGLYISGHPLAKYEADLRAFSSMPLSDITPEHQGRELSLAGIITNLQIKKSQKSGKRYATGTLEDLNGTIDIMIFSSVLDRFESQITASSPVMAGGVLETENSGSSGKKFIVKSVKQLKEIRRQAVSGIHINLDPVGVDENLLNSLKNILVRHKGECPIFFHVKEKDGEKVIKVHSAFNIAPTEKFVNDISKIVGNESVKYSFSHH